LKPILRKLLVGLNFCWKLFEWIMARYEKTIPGSRDCDPMAVKLKPFSGLKPVFSLRAVIHEFFQKKFKPT